MAKNIILIGFMAAGKSSVGRVLAQQLGWFFVDTDQMIEEVTGLKIPELFRRCGEKRLRSEERLIVDRMVGVVNTVIATGGGTVLEPDNWMTLKKLGLTVHLYVELESALQRAKRRPERPLLRKSMSEIQQMWTERLTIYNQADKTIDTTDKEVSAIVAEILSQLKGGYANHAAEN